MTALPIGSTDEHTLENNQALHDLLGIAVQPLPLDEILRRSLDILLSLSWLKLLPKAGVFLTERNENGVDELKLYAERNIGEPIKTLCAKVAFGHCLCGQAAASRMAVHADCVDHRHETTFPGIKPHGHYNIPILFGERVLGVMVFYLPHGMARSAGSVAFLERVASTLAMVIKIRESEGALARQLREYDNQKRAVDLHSIVKITDADGLVRYANEKFCALSGYTSAELIGQPTSITHAEVRRPDFYENLWATIRSGQTWQGELRNKAKDGSIFWTKTSIVPNLDDDGVPFQFVSISTDITEQKQIEEALTAKSDELARRMSEMEESRYLMEEQSAMLVELAEDQGILRSKAEAAERSKGEFLATMSHEIRTPMTGILGMAELLLSEQLPAAQREKVRTIKNSGDVLLAILNDILDQARLESGKLHIENIDFHLPSLIDSVLRLMVPKAEEKDLSLSLNAIDDLPKGINADPVRLRQILINLISNAIKFSSEGKIEIVVKTERQDDDDFLRFDVIDQGIGISEQNQARLFRRFEQAEASTARTYGGSGLGLSICRQLIELMGGQIGVHSVSGKGSTFWFTLPLRDAISDVTPDNQPTVERVPVASRELNILLAEDNRVNQTLITSVLAKIGHRVTVAQNGAEAVAIADGGGFDLILMDVRMPVMDGMTATREIRASGGSHAHIPIIAVTADAMLEHFNNYMESGMSGVATKPIQLTELLRTIDDVLKDNVHTWHERAIAAPPPPPEADHIADAEQAMADINAFLEGLKSITGAPDQDASS